VAAGAAATEAAVPAEDPPHEERANANANDAAARTKIAVLFIRSISTPRNWQNKNAPIEIRDGH
jgi:hypothetical protein